MGVGPASRCDSAAGGIRVGCDEAGLVASEVELLDWSPISQLRDGDIAVGAETVVGLVELVVLLLVRPARAVSICVTKLSKYSWELPKRMLEHMKVTMASDSLLVRVDNVSMLGAGGNLPVVRMYSQAVAACVPKPQHGHLPTVGWVLGCLPGIVLVGCWNWIGGGGCSDGRL
jgi:hypothetical protein